MQVFSQATFVLSAPSLKDLPLDQGRELVMLGRSNVGKSSLINALCGQKGLAQTSKTPGRTRFLNVYRLSDTQRLIDAPGYGFARVSKEASASWERLIESYLAARQSLSLVLLVMDIRHPLQPQDMRWLDQLQHYPHPIWIVLNKKDCLGYEKRLQAERKVEAYCKVSGVCARVLSISCLKRQGVDGLLTVVKSHLAGE